MVNAVLMHWSEIWTLIKQDNCKVETAEELSLWSVAGVVPAKSGDTHRCKSSGVYIVYESWNTVQK